MNKSNNPTIKVLSEASNFSAAELLLYRNMIKKDSHPINHNQVIINDLSK